MPSRRPLPVPGESPREPHVRPSRQGPGTRTPRIHDIGDLLAAATVVLGFRPRDSLIVVGSGGVHGVGIGPTARIDLPPPELVPLLTGRMAEHLLHAGAGTAAVIVVGGGVPCAPDDAPSARVPRPDVVAAAVAALTERRITVHTTVWASAVEEGATWRCYDECDCSGPVPDPNTTEVVVSNAAAGKIVYHDRAELEQLVAPSAASRDRVPAGTPTGIDLYREQGSWAQVAEDEFEQEMEGIELLEAYRERAAQGVLELDDAAVRQLGEALTRSAVRDAVLTLALDHDGGGDSVGRWDLAPGAEALWAALCRELPDPDAADAAALLAAAALVQGEGALANVALDRAETSSPGHRLAELLRAVADRVIPPPEVRKVLLGSLR